VTNLPFLSWYDVQIAGHIAQFGLALQQDMAIWVKLKCQRNSKQQEKNEKTGQKRSPWCGACRPSAMGNLCCPQEEEALDEVRVRGPTSLRALLPHHYYPLPLQKPLLYDYSQQQQAVGADRKGTSPAASSVVRTGLPPPSLFSSHAQAQDAALRTRRRRRRRKGERRRRRRRTRASQPSPVVVVAAAMSTTTSLLTALTTITAPMMMMTTVVIRTTATTACRSQHQTRQQQQQQQQRSPTASIPSSFLPI